MVFYLAWIPAAVICWAASKIIDNAESGGQYARLYGFLAGIGAGAAVFALGYWAFFIGYTETGWEGNVFGTIQHTNPVAGGVMMGLGVIWAIFGSITSITATTEQKLEQHKQTMEQFEKELPEIKRRTADLIGKHWPDKDIKNFKCPLCHSDTISQVGSKGKMKNVLYFICENFRECEGKIQVSSEGDVFLLGKRGISPIKED